MIRAEFLSPTERVELTGLARNGLVEHRLARRANALVLLDRGMSCAEVSSVFLLDDDTVRRWFRLYREGGIEGLFGFSYEGSACNLSIEQAFSITYQSRSGLVTLLHRLGMAHRKPQAVSQKLDVAKQKAFIEAYDTLLNGLPDDEAVMFADAVHPTHAARPVGCRAPRDTRVATSQTSGRERMNIHGAIDLETGQTRMCEVVTVAAMSGIALLTSIEALYPAKRLIHVFLDNARYHHANLVRAWLAHPGRRIKLHFVLAYCPHLNPIERLWGLMHKNVTHTRCYATFPEIGAIYAIMFQTISASYRPGIFGF